MQPRRNPAGPVRRLLLPAAALLLLAPAPDPVRSAEIRPDRLTGEVFLGGATPIDPPPGEPAGTHAYVAITGAAARRLYDAMPGPAGRAGCEAGRRTKRAGHLTCAAGRRAAEARCDFSIVLGRGELGPGPPC